MYYNQKYGILKNTTITRNSCETILKPSTTKTTENKLSVLPNLQKKYCIQFSIVFSQPIQKKNYTLNILFEYRCKLFLHKPMLINVFSRLNFSVKPIMIFATTYVCIKTIFLNCT